MRDITERQKQTAALELQATTDPLTGVANRTVLMDRLHQGLRRLGRNRGLLAVLYLDLDHFKVINDSLGHRIGDDVLLKIAERLTHHLRPADTLARLGGDEFVLVAEGVSDEAAAITLANRIIEDGRKPFRLDGDEFSCTMSIGVPALRQPAQWRGTALRGRPCPLPGQGPRPRPSRLVRRGATHHCGGPPGHRTYGAAGS